MPEISVGKVTLQDALTESAPPMPGPVPRARASASRTAMRETIHEHPYSPVGVILGKDQDGRRITGYAPGREPKYVFACKACQAADRKRMSEPPTLSDADFDITLFLVPEPMHYDTAVCHAYLARRYPDTQLEVTAAFNPYKLAFLPGAQIVVVTARGVGSNTKRQIDEEGKFEDFPIPPETYLDKVIESAPVKVSECVAQVAASMYSEQKADMTELVARLSELAFPYRIAIPADPKDSLYIMRQNF